MDWEYPANRDTEDRPDDKLFFTILCKVGILQSRLILEFLSKKKCEFKLKELHAAFKHHNFILTAAVAAGVKYINSAYEIAEIHKSI